MNHTFLVPVKDLTGVLMTEVVAETPEDAKSKASARGYQVIGEPEDFGERTAPSLDNFARDYGNAVARAKRRQMVR